MQSNNSEWMKIGDEVIRSGAVALEASVGDPEGQCEGDDCVLRMVIECREVEPAVKKNRQYRVRFTSVVQESAEGVPLAESSFFDVQRGDLKLLEKAISQVREHVEQHACGYLEKYVASLCA